MKKILDFIVKHEFWFTMLIVFGLYIGEYLTRIHWMSSLGFLLFLIAITRLASHPMWEKDKEK
jgi:hypothetical protein